MVQHVFIPYHHGDLDFAENVINRVEKAGYPTWTDDKLHAGEDWWAMIDIAIKNAFALVVIMTPEAKASAVRREVLSSMPTVRTTQRFLPNQALHLL